MSGWYGANEQDKFFGCQEGFEQAVWEWRESGPTSLLNKQFTCSQPRWPEMQEENQDAPGPTSGTFFLREAA